MLNATPTFVAFGLVHLLDQGATADLDEVSQHVKDETIVDWLSETFPFPQLDVSLLTAQGSTDGQELAAMWASIDNAYGPSKFGVEHNGLLYLLALALESAQQVMRSLGA